MTAKPRRCQTRWAGCPDPDERELMSYSDDEIEAAYDRTDGNCHLCGGRMAWSNYGKPGRRQAWEMEHSRPRGGGWGGTDHANNRYGAHVSCNRSKGTRSTRSARRDYGRTRAPLSRSTKVKLRRRNAAIGSGVGAVVGSAGGPLGAVLGGVFGSWIGDSIEIDND